MKRALLSLFLLLNLFAFTSCEQDNDDLDPNSNYQVPGLYVGTYTITQLPASGAIYYSFSLQPNGKVTTTGLGANGTTYYSAGTWTKTGNTVNCTYTTLNFNQGPPVTQSAELTFDPTTGNLTAGTWADGANGSNYTGTFPVMDRVK